MPISRNFSLAELALEQVPPGAEDPVGKHCRVFELEIARPALEISGLELEHHGLSGNAGGLEPGGHLFRQSLGAPAPDPSAFDKSVLKVVSADTLLAPSLA
jgi:hypothetical protein